MKGVLSLNDVGFVYSKSGETVLSGVDLRVEPGEVVAVTGPSGAGKSTLLFVAGLLTRPTSGQVVIDGQPCAGLDEAAAARIRSEKVGFMFQSFNLLHQMTALENVMLGGSSPGGVSRAVAEDWLGRVGLADRRTHRPDELSAGQQQRVAFARAVAKAPRLLLADEPTGNLDPDAETSVLELVRGSADAGTAVVVVTHSRRVSSWADRHVTMSAGRLVEQEVAS